MAGYPQNEENWRSKKITDWMKLPLVLIHHSTIVILTPELVVYAACFDSLMTSMGRACGTAWTKVHQHRLQPPILRVGYEVFHIAIALNDKTKSKSCVSDIKSWLEDIRKIPLTRTCITANLRMTHTTVLDFLRSLSASNVRGRPPQHLLEEVRSMSRDV